MLKTIYRQLRTRSYLQALRTTWSFETELMFRMILIYLLTEIGFKHGGSCKYAFTHKQYKKQHNQTEYNTYITIKVHKHTIRIHKHNNKDT